MLIPHKFHRPGIVPGRIPVVREGAVPLVPTKPPPQGKKEKAGHGLSGRVPWCSQSSSDHVTHKRNPKQSGDVGDALTPLARLLVHDRPFDSVHL
ncbi:hypothetical protein GDO81_022194 [Engystomops pustulosus]|uniref:Uncharacterized protein n=1 Tax=Engystomops pustulosus TaxID=76066 RepID=A0AAV6ZEA4_ENGPU|nr:hypothetical protein GDO81_022194 [Engystomops pustulosus]